MSEIRRYHIMLADCGYAALEDEASENVSGYWCKHEDHEAIIEELESQLDVEKVLAANHMTALLKMAERIKELESEVPAPTEEKEDE